MGLDVWFQQDMARIMASTHETMTASVRATAPLDAEIAEAYQKKLHGCTASSRGGLRCSWADQGWLRHANDGTRRGSAGWPSILGGRGMEIGAVKSVNLVDLTLAMKGLKSELGSGLRHREGCPLPVCVVQGFRVLQGITTGWHGAYQWLQRGRRLESRWERWGRACVLPGLQQSVGHARCQAQHLFEAVGENQEPFQGRTRRLVGLIDPFDYDRQAMACDLYLCLHVHRALILTRAAADVNHRNPGRQNGAGLHPPNWVALNETMSRTSRSVNFADLRHFAWEVQIGNRFRFGRQGLGECKITNLLILECARGASAGLAKTDTVTVLTDAEAGDKTRRVKEEEKGAKTATVAVLRRGLIAMRNGCGHQNQKISDSGRAEGLAIDNLSSMGHGSGKLVNFTNLAALAVRWKVT